MPDVFSSHPIPDNSETQVWITPDFKLNCTVVSSELNSVDGEYHYHLQAQFNNPATTSAAVQLTDVVENFVLLNPDL